MQNVLCCPLVDTLDAHVTRVRQKANIIKTQLYFKDPANHVFVHFQVRSALQGLQQSQDTGSTAGGFTRTCHKRATDLTIGLTLFIV